jgi:photosystem II stability/assembly factor-like uncharacterized protein
MLMPAGARSDPLSDSPSRTQPGRYERAGLDGTAVAHMQPVNTGLPIGLVASVPGSASAEAWGVAVSSAPVPRWAGPGGQTVFLRYTRASGWRLMGPPRGESGAPINPSIHALAFAPNGEGWAVGDGGTVLRLVNGIWREAPSSTTHTLISISIRSDARGTYGYAAGDGPTILRLSNGRWSQDQIVEADSEWVLHSVSAVSRTAGWAAGSAGGAVLVLHGSRGRWERVPSGIELFDSDGAREIQQTVVRSTPAWAVAASAKGAWVSGTIVPLDTGTTLNDPVGDPTRPFVLRFTRTDAPAKSYCPDRYSFNGKESSTEALCDLPFPLTGFGLVAMQLVQGPRGEEVFAGGLGLFHHVDGRWQREPDPIGFVGSVAFGNTTEGWIAGPGDAYGVPTAFSTIATLGHWTRTPAKSRVARWPQPITLNDELRSAPLEAVALAPDGSGRALAVGQEGALVGYAPGVRWDSFQIVTRQPLHDVAWPSADQAWAVGGGGTILRYDGAQWVEDEASRHLTTAALFGVAFATPNEGYAVGAGGALLRFANGRWTKDRGHLLITQDDLYAIAIAGSEFVAVGADATVITAARGRWRAVPAARSISKRGDLLPSFYAVAGLPDGTTFVGGELGTLIRRNGTGRWSIDVEGDRVPPEGTIIALAAATGSGGGHKVLASISEDPLKYGGQIPAAVTGYTMLGTSAGWTDLGHDTFHTIYPAFDASATHDPAYDIVWDGNSTAWAVGGTGPGADDGRGHAQAYGTSSIYRIDLKGDPRPPEPPAAPILDADPNVVSFAFFGESSCAKGLCTFGMGSGTKADIVARQIQQEINRASRLPGGPRFAVFGGNMRQAGTPEELGEFKRYLKGFEIPVFATMGSSDLFSGLDTTVVNDTAKRVVEGGADQGTAPADDSFYLDTFKDMPKPWGTKGPTLPRIEPVQIGLEATEGARTHYAFDYVEGSKRLRVAVVDDSIDGRMSDQTTQNPSQPQRAWLELVLKQAPEGTASVIVMNRPSRNPLEPVKVQSAYLDAASVESTAAQLGASAVFTSFYRLNAVGMIGVPGVASSVPVYVFGGGGAPLEARKGKPPAPGLGYYHSWQLAAVNFDPARRPLPLRRAEVYVQSIPIVENAALHAIDGVEVQTGWTLSFAGSGRVPDGGSADPLQSYASLVPFNSTSRGFCPPDPGDSLRAKCRGLIGGPVGPSFFFTSENPDVGYFVAPHPINARYPQVDGNGRPVPDPTSGLFCAIHPGKTVVNLITGFHRARMEVTVTGGEGPCVRSAIFPPLPEPNPVPVPRVSAVAPHLPLGHAVQESQQIVVLPPPPVPIVAPAPPVAAGYARKEKHESAREEQGSDARALRPVSRYEPSEDPTIMILCIAASSVMASLVAVGIARRRREFVSARARNARWGGGFGS